MRGSRTLVPCTLAVIWPLAAVADDAVSRGAAVADQWCRHCHPRADDPPAPRMAFAFEDIVMRKGRDRDYFSRFVREDHFPMTTFRLFEHEKDDIVAWLMALQDAQR
ncbi:hypothetical protein [Oricola thermophila]|uniref:Cytochrome c domain-containing protein n=1 Tax=Oricola thermophila TaxID=2742145 RepID=A0A6N1VBS9_9HYPH|nr:hypothetical protein [Oricola thermophila]QKV18138.1 hypothetical protein HTY61_06560 [Oricola thermophila]